MPGPSSPAPGGLQRRFFLSIFALVAGLMIAVLLLVASREGRLFRQEAEKRALAVARNLAAASDTALRTYNYVALEQSVEKVAREADLAYVVILDKEGRVAAFSDHDEYQGGVLDDPVSRAAQAARGPLVQETTWTGRGGRQEPVLDVAVPVVFNESPERWGTVRIGLSLAAMRQELLRTQLVLAVLGVVALAAGLGGAHLFARRVTHPVLRLAAGASDLAAGRVGLQLDIRTGDELEMLARAFNHMSAELAANQAALERNVALLDALTRYQEDILRSMDEGLLTVDLDGRVVKLNRVGAEMLGLGERALEGRPALETIVATGEPLARVIRAGLDGKPSTHREVELAVNGRTVPLGVSTAPLLDASGAGQGVLVLFRDLTALKALEARMRRADKLAALGTMSAGLAHEIKNPLAAIKTFVQLVPRKFDSETFREKFSVTVPRELDRVNGIVENLLELARSPRMTVVPVDLNDVLKRLLDLHSKVMEDRRIVLEAALLEGLPAVRGDAEYLHRAFGNLVVNAIQAMPDGGRLGVVTGAPGDAAAGTAAMVTVKVTDTGVGMDGETVRQLFNPFFTTKAKGTGLGLALAHKIVEEHGGAIGVESRRGGGAVFTVTLPVADPSG